MKHKYIILVLMLAFIYVFIPSAPLQARAPSEEEINSVLASAESLFKAMRDRRYSTIWKTITDKSKKRIIDSTYAELKKAGNETRKENIEDDFREGEEISRAYWEGYLQVFNPQIVLEQSRWAIGVIGRDKAEISIHFKKSKHPAILKLFRENNEWKVGLDETFRGRSLLLF